METNKASVKISLKDGTFEIEGSEEFLNIHMDFLKEFVNQNIQFQYQDDSDEDIADNSDLPGPEAAPHTKSDGKITYTKVLHLEGETVKIIKKMPGSNKAQKSINTALVYLWGKRELGIDNIPFTEIRELCKNQGCLDSANFAAHMKSAREDIIVDGKSGSAAKTCKLTIPGVEKAENLISTLNGA